MTHEQIMMSETLATLSKLAKSCPIDVNDPESLKSALISAGLDLADALDNGRISFDRDEDAATLYGLMTVVIDYGLDGKLKTAFKTAACH